jgi:hypothetical protein
MEEYSLGMNDVKVNFPGGSYDRFAKACRLLGYAKRGHRWKLLDLLLAYAEQHPDIFKSR